MLPSFFVYLDQMPLNSSGKVDRKVLPEPDFSIRSSNKLCIEPRTPLEQELSNIWSETLCIKSFGIYDNFFELGGHSLLATQVNARIRRNYGVEMPLKTLFERPTIAS